MGYFADFSAFVAMGGHGPYVWSTYGMTLVVLVWLLLRPLARSRQLLRQLRRQQQRQASVSGTTVPDRMVRGPASPADGN